MGDGTVRLYYGGSSGPHDGVNATTRLGLATLKASDRWVGFKQQSATAATVRVSVLCEGATLLIGADLAGAASLRAGATGLPGLALTDAVELKAADAHGPDVTAKFKVRRRLPRCRVVVANYRAAGAQGGKTFAAHVGKVVELEIELSGGARAFSVAWV
eukprot:COSAG04_NODE_113_length_25735_cov_4.728468_9_plen_159_part_00